MNGLLLAARRVAIGVGTTAGVTGVGVTAYAFSEQGLGFRREVQFWGVISPVVFDYWWNSSKSSPYVKLKNRIAEARASESESDSDSATNTANEKNSSNNEERGEAKDKYTVLHSRNAPRVFQVMLDLGGLYIKLGQVLSVTALPIPDAYREEFRTLQSNVPGHEEFETVVKPTLEREFGRSLDEIFSSFEEDPIGAASIGQAHKATLLQTGEDVVVKVQYPDAKWQVPADIQCVGDFMKLCVYFGLVDESAAQMSFDEFSRQFLAELDYDQERRNLEEVYESSLDPTAPYIQRNVILPRVFPDLCTDQVITMTYLPGPKFEEEAKRQLALLGFDTNRKMRDVVQDATREDQATKQESSQNSPRISFSQQKSWQQSAASLIGNIVGVDTFFSFLRGLRRAILWSRVALVSSIRVVSAFPILPSTWEDWAKKNENVALQMERLDWIHEAVYALLDVHGYQILNQGLFNADPHPGNLLIVQEEAKDGLASSSDAKIGLIDYGQCKRLTVEERVKVAKLLLSVANDSSDETVAAHFRDLGIQTKNDSTLFLAEFARLMFGSFQPKHMDHAWHKQLHENDRVLYFPNELSMVYRTSLLLRGLAMSLQLNVAIGEQWQNHAKLTVEEHGK